MFDENSNETNELKKERNEKIRKLVGIFGAWVVGARFILMEFF
jgi:hypothetical protein